MIKKLENNLFLKYEFINNDPFIEIYGNVKKFFKISFIDYDNNKIIYETILSTNNWAKVNNQLYKKNWNIKILDIEKNSIIFDYIWMGKDFYINNKKIQIIHLLSNIDNEKEKLSVKYISELKNYNINYTQHINKPYDEIAPKDFCNRPEHISLDNKPGHIGKGYGKLTGRHYGCFLAHINALKNINDNYDYTLIFENDANIQPNYDDFIDILYKSMMISEKHDVYFISFSNNPSNHKENIDEFFIKTGYNQIALHAYLIPNRYKNFYIDRINDTKWDGADIWYNIIFNKHKKLRYTTNKIYSIQLDGLSLIDNVYKKY